MSWKYINALVLALTVMSCAGLGASTGKEDVSSTRTGVHEPKEDITLLAVGDVNLGRTCGQMILKYGPSYPFGHLREWIESYDIAFCNLESTISDQNGETFKPYNRLIFTSPPQSAEALKIGGWDIVSTANNHANDYGINALDETIFRLDDVGIAYNGSGLDKSELYRPTYLNVCDYVVAFIAVTDIMNGEYFGTNLENHLNWADKEKVLPALREARHVADYVILSYHGGVEYTSHPTEQTREFLRWAIDNGVDIVLGHHPHFFQDAEWYHGRLVIYSLGNFTFYQAGWMNWTDYGIAASITLGDDGIRKVEFIPIQAHYQPSIITDEKLKARILKRLFDISGGDPTLIPPDVKYDGMTPPADFM